jgi:hypothetical protein
MLFAAARTAVKAAEPPISVGPDVRGEQLEPSVIALRRSVCIDWINIKVDERFSVRQMTEQGKSGPSA